MIHRYLDIFLIVIPRTLDLSTYSVLAIFQIGSIYKNFLKAVPFSGSSRILEKIGMKIQFSRKLFTKYLDTFSHFTIAYIHHKRNGSKLLQEETKFTSCGLL